MLPSAASSIWRSPGGLVRGPRIRPIGAIAVLIVLSLVLAACGSSSSRRATGSTTTVFTGEVPQRRNDHDRRRAGARLLRLARQLLGLRVGHLDGADPDRSRTRSSPSRRTARSSRSRARCSRAMPTCSATPVQTITYNINPKAVWSDGVPITCADFQYTADQQQTGKDLYDPTGLRRHRQR